MSCKRKTIIRNLIKGIETSHRQQLMNDDNNNDNETLVYEKLKIYIGFRYSDTVSSTMISYARNLYSKLSTIIVTLNKKDKSGM